MSVAAPPRSPLRTLAATEYSKGMKWSLYGHGAIILYVLIKSLIFPDRPRMYIPTLRVDIVGLPDILKKDLNQMKSPTTSASVTEALKQAEADSKKSAKAKAEPKEKANPDEMVLQPKNESSAAREKRLKQALKRMQALAKISDESPTNSKAPLIKGNIKSPGTSLSGDAREAAQASYYDTLRERLQENWTLNRYLARQDYVAQVQLFIDQHGKVKSYAFIKASGNAQFDDAVKRAIRESQPFPHPPSELVSSMLTHGILVGFPL